MILETKNLRKSFKTKNESVDSVKDLSISIQRGEIFGFIGPNGAGKTTSMRMLATLVKPSGGTAKIDGHDLTDEAHKVRKVIGYVSQNGGLDQYFTAKENLIFQAQLYGLTKSDATKRADELIAALKLESFAHRVVTTYSGGQRRRVDIAMALMHKPKLLFLDEPTTGLDPKVELIYGKRLLRLSKRGTTVFLYHPLFR